MQNSPKIWNHVRKKQNSQDILGSHCRSYNKHHYVNHYWDLNFIFTAKPKYSRASQRKGEHQKYLESNTDWLNVWQTWANERKINNSANVVFCRKCSVALLKWHLRRRPQELRDKGPFYFVIIENPKTKVRYMKQRRKQHRQYRCCF